MANYTVMKILNFKDLKEYTCHLIKGGAKLAYAAHVSAIDNVKAPSLRAEIERLKSHIESLNALRDAMNAQESEAGRNALQLYWENCTLQKYKDHANGILSDWIHRDDYNRVADKLNETQKKLMSVSLALDEQMAEWTAYMRSVPVRPAPKRPAKAK